MSVEHVKAAIESATDFTPEPPRPLVRAMPPADPFPVNSLGDLLGAAAKAVHDRTQAPMAICGQSVLAASTLAVQGHVDVVLPTGQARPTSGFFVTVAATGERKSACDAKALWPIRKHEESLRDRYDADLPAWQNDKDAWDKQRVQILNDRKNCPDHASKRRALTDLGPAPAAPLIPMLSCPEPTFEGLCRLLAAGLPSVGVFSGEGGQFIGGYGMSDDQKLKTAAAFSGLWDGEPIKRVRASDGAVTLPGRRVAMHLMVQPDVAALMLSDRVLADQGLLSRLLVTAPEMASGTRFWREPRPECDVAKKRYDARLLSILEAPLPLAEGQRNELVPRRLPLSADARGVWIAFADHVEKLIAPDGDFESIRGFANKLAEHAARVAAVITLVDDLKAPEVPREFMWAGIDLAAIIHDGYRI